MSARTGARRVGPLVAAIVALLLFFRFVLGVEIFLSPRNLINLMEQISVDAILAFGMTLTILIGGIDLSVGRVTALTGTVTVYWLARNGDAPESAVELATALIVGLGAAAIVGSVNGTLAAKSRMPPFIITLAMLMVTRGLALSFNEARPIPVPRPEAAFLAIGNYQILDLVPIPVVVMLAVFFAMVVILHATRFGQHLYAIGGNREAARFAGIATERHEIIVYVLCSTLAGVAGIIQASQLNAAVPAAGEGLELNAIAAAVVGGTSFTGGVGTMHGTLLGAIIIGILNKGLNQAGVHFSLQYLVKGLVILAAVYLDVWRRK
jgi:ribose transport system permease protein